MKRLIALAFAIALAPLAWAADPPGRVGRLSLVDGEASVFADREQGWERARVNSHLTSENSVWTEPQSRAEVRFGSTALRLGEATQLDILRLDDESFQAHLPRGTLSVRIRDLDARESYAITTPSARYQLRANGRYRVDFDPARGESRLSVLAGTARMEVAGGYVSVDTGRAVRVSAAEGDSARFEFENAWSSPLDDWALARDQRAENREAARYVPPQMTGWEDLDDYGVWRNEAEYGAVWYPTRVEAGWAPYRYGRWTWVRPWGWTWVDDAPWGYAPFHYGRWVYVGNRWGWYPGRYTARPVWAPALVGWIGGPGWSVTLSTGRANVVGWYPLSPYDAYQPWYAANATYVTHINHVVLPPRPGRDYRGDRHDDRRGGERHDNRDRGATVMPREQFGSRRPVQAVLAPVGGEAVRAQPVVSGSTVLPSQGEWRARTKPAEATPAPRPAVGGQPATAPVTRVAPAMPSKPVTPFAPAPEAAPAPSPAPAAQSSRVVRPVPVEPSQRAVPAAPPSQPAAQSQAVAKPAAAPAQHAPSTQAAPSASPAPAAQSSRVVRPVPVEPSQHAVPAAPPSQPAAQPQAVPKPAAPPQPAAQSQAVPKPAPAAKPAPAQERPAKGHEAPAKPVEKPARVPDQGSGG